MPATVFLLKRSDPAGQKIQKANREAVKARDAIAKGNLAEARRRMELIVKIYPDTPQAKQARIFLNSLPE